MAPGLTLNASTGVITGTPTTATGSPFGFSVTVKDSVGNTSAAQALSITILAAPAITTSSLSNGTVGTAYSQTLSANGGTPPYSNWIVSGGALPPGLALNASNGIISGTPSTAIGSPYNFSVTVKDSAGNTSLAQSFSIAIAAAPGPIISSVSPLSGPAAGVRRSASSAATLFRAPRCASATPMRPSFNSMPVRLP